MLSTERVKPEKIEMDLSSGRTSARRGLPVGLSVLCDMPSLLDSCKWMVFWSLVLAEAMFAWPGGVLSLNRRGESNCAEVSVRRGKSVNVNFIVGGCLGDVG